MVGVVCDDACRESCAMVVDLGRRTEWPLKQGGWMDRGNSSRKLQESLKSTARSSKLPCFVLRVVVVSVLADFVAKLDRSLSQPECRVSVAASSHAIDVGMRHDEESQKQILLIRR